ncbi:MAG: hypothetical protein JWO62_3796 [Acidimicrobiaceae bacterium]|nr:hypothetical protein [Acidimicrobiaceae bacterium]
MGAELLALATPRAEAARQSAPPMVPVQTIRAAAPLPVPVPAAPRPTPANPVVQRSMLGDVFQGGQSSFGDSIGSMFGKKKREAMSEEEIRTLANRIYPYISQRLKVELRRDRERAGMITGLHQ